MNTTAKTLLSLYIGLSIGACGNPFASDAEKAEEEPSSTLTATTPEILMDNLVRAMNSLDKDLYKEALDERFWFTETDCQGHLVLANGFAQELEYIGSNNDSATPGIFSVFPVFEYQFQLIRRSIEHGPDFPKADANDPDGHPDEDWQVFRGRVQMLLLNRFGDGFSIDQVMTYKMRLAEDGAWKIVRWIDDPLSGDCGAGKNAAVYNYSWGLIKSVKDKKNSYDRPL